MAALSKGIYLVDTCGLGFRNVVAAYIVSGERYAAIIDTGYSSSANIVVKAVAEVGAMEKLRYIIPTHAHLDHCGATGDLAIVYPRAEVLAHERALPHLINPSRLLESVRAIYDDSTLSAMGLLKPTDSERAHILGDGEEINLQGLTLRSIYTHGHAPHHLSIHIEERGYVVTGDAVPSRYPFTSHFIPNIVPPRFDYDQAIKSIAKIFDLNPRLLLTPHYGPLIPSQSLQEKYFEVIREVVEIAREGIGRGVGVDELRTRLAECIARSSDLKSLHPTVQTAIRLAAVALYQTYKSST